MEWMLPGFESCDRPGALTDRSIMVTFAAAPSLWIITIMTCQAGCSAQVFCVAGTTGTAAMVHAAAPFIGDARMRTVIRRRPAAGRMAGGAVQPEHPGMVGRIGMAVCAGCRKAGELSRCMASFTGQAGMPARQWEIAEVVIEGYILPARWSMAGGAVRAVLAVMLVVLLVAGIAVGGSA